MDDDNQEKKKSAQELLEERVIEDRVKEIEIAMIKILSGDFTPTEQQKKFSAYLKWGVRSERNS